MSEKLTVTHRMDEMLSRWQQQQDRRASFLGCYSLMTKNMLQAIEAGRFIDAQWVGQLLNLFADYYFVALDKYEASEPEVPAVWRFVHDQTCNCSLNVIQDLLLGINAHINYDLVFTLVDMLAPEWETLTAEQRQARYLDHQTVNTVIAETIDTVQDTIIEVRSPWLDIIDRVFGRLDEMLLSRLISSWREDVWHDAVRILEAEDPLQQQEIRRQIELRVMRRAKQLVEFV